MAKCYNSCEFIGYLSKDPEMRYTPQGSAVVSMSLAVNKQKKDGTEETEWVNLVAWDKLAEICNQYLTTGSRIFTRGELKTRSWEDAQTGQRRYKSEIIMNEMVMLGGGAGTEQAAAPRTTAKSQPQAVQDAMAQRMAAGNPRPPSPFARPVTQNEEDLDPNDIPF